MMFNYFPDILYFFVYDYQSSHSKSKKFFWIAASVADTPAVILNSTKTLLADGIDIFFVYGNLTDINGQRKLRHPSF